MTRNHASGRGWAYTGAALGAVVSIAANVAHSYVPPDGAAPGWRPHAGAVVGAVFWPIALLVAVEILARTAWPDGARWVVLRMGGLLPVAVVAAVVSYRHLSGLLAFYGEDPLTARIGPLAVDGLMVMATGALIATAARVAVPGPRTVGVPLPEPAGYTGYTPVPAPSPAPATTLAAPTATPNGTTHALPVTPPAEPYPSTPEPASTPVPSTPAGLYLVNGHHPATNGIGAGHTTEYSGVPAGYNGTSTPRPADHDAAHATAAGTPSAPVPGRPYPLPVPDEDDGPDPVPESTESDAEIVQAITDTGAVPSVRAIKTTYRVGQARAYRIREQATDRLGPADTATR